jgi:acetyltransferase
MNLNLNYFFNPRAVAVVGASNDKNKIGRQILDNIVESGFPGRIYPINLKEKKIAGLKAYVQLTDFSEPDFAKVLVVIAIPGQFVLAEIEKCAQIGIKNIVIITSGFKESGRAGQKMEEAIVQIARKNKLNILGPNCLGLINKAARLNATFAAAGKTAGSCALISQSGAVGSAVLDWLRSKDFGLGRFVSLGNKAVLDENDIINHLASDKDIDLVIAYLEEIKDGRRFMEIVSRLSKYKPVAILKAGMSEVGSRMAMSHTGSMAGSAAAVKAGVERAGAIWLDNLSELFNLLTLFREKERLNSEDKALSIVTNAGGMAVLTADEISRQGLSLGISNDILGDADADCYREALHKMLSDKKINNILIILTPQTSTEVLKTAEEIVAVAKKFPRKFLMASFLGGEGVKLAREFLNKNRIPHFDYPDEAVRIFKKVKDYQNTIKSLRRYSSSVQTRAVRSVSPDYLDSFSLLKKYGFSIIKTVKYSAGKESSYKYPAVLKATGPEFLHKSDKGGVVVGLKTAEELRLAARILKKKNERAFRNPENYLVVQEQATGFQEIILGFKRDASFGPIMMIGQGGIYAEVLKDFKLSAGGVDFRGALKIISGLKIYPILNGARGQKKYDLRSLAAAMVNLSKLADEHPEILEFDINPLFVFEKGVAAGDIRIIV